MEGLSVLEIGCDHEGWLCAEAVAQKARRVLGLVAEADRLAPLRQAIPDAEFRLGTWDEAPDELFDVIFLVSQFEYGENAKQTFANLSQRLAPGGVLIADCPHLKEAGDRRWKVIRHRNGQGRYPSLPLLQQDILAPYAVRDVNSAACKDVPSLRRTLLHCTPRVQVAMLVAAPSGRGKTSLAALYRRQNVPVIATDHLLWRLHRDADYRWRPLAAEIRSFVGKEPPDWGAVGRLIAERPELTAELCETIISELPTEVDFFVIEGEVLRHELVLAELGSSLKRRAIRVWVSKPL